MAGGADSLKSVLYALVANISIAIAKFAGAIFTGSGSLMAEAVHSTADSCNQVLLLLGMKRAKLPPNDNYPLGSGKEIYFWSFLVAVLLFTMGGLFSIYEGWHKIQHPEALRAAHWAIGILIFAVFAEGSALFGVTREVNKVRAGRSLWQWFRESRKSELVVIVGEDLAALLGLTFALIAVTLTVITGNPVYDALGSVAIGSLLLLVAVLVGNEVKKLLIGEGVEPLVREKMTRFLNAQPEIDHVMNFISLHMGDDVMIAVKVRMLPATSDTALIANINSCEARFRKKFPEVAWLFFEPDNKD